MPINWTPNPLDLLDSLEDKVHIELLKSRPARAVKSRGRLPIDSLPFEKMFASQKTIWDYFNLADASTKFLLHDPFPYGSWSVYSSSFLNGTIGYVEPLAVYQLDRYTPDTSKIKIFASLAEGGQTEELVFSKAKLRELILEEAIYFTNTNLSMFDDDIIILARVPNPEDETTYAFFWFDRDVSECIFGKFITTDSVETITAAIEHFLPRHKGVVEKGYDKGVVSYQRLPLSFLSGRFKF
jgi:hypothetical protein